MIRFLVINLVFMILFASCGGGSAKVPPHVLLVDEAAFGVNNGLTWSNAYESLQDALSVAVKGNEIWVAEGVYYPSDVGDRAKTFQLISGVHLYGGFSGNETLRSERDWFSNITILSGDIGVEVVNTDNSHHVVTGIDESVIDGFTISNGYSRSTAEEGGAGILNINASPCIFNCLIKDNLAGYGAGICNKNNSSPVIGACVIKKNKSLGTHGGGISNLSNSNPVFSGCTISANEASIGAGIYSEYSTPSLANCDIINNLADSGGGGVLNTYSNSIFTSCNISNNRASILNSTTNGGGVLNAHSDAIFRNCLIAGNAAGTGAGVYNGVSNPIITNCTVSDNDAEFGGGGIYSYDSDLVVTNTIIWGNKVNGVNSVVVEDDWAMSGGSVPLVAYSLFIGAVTGVGNVAGSPMYSDVSASDYTLKDNSLAIDAGNNASIAESTDITGVDARKINGLDLHSIFVEVVDIGAYESQNIGPTSLLASPIFNN